MVLQAMMNAIPRTRGKNGDFIRPEAKVLDDLRLGFFNDLTAPPDEELKIPLQPKLPGEVGDDLPEEELEEESEE